MNEYSNPMWPPAPDPAPQAEDGTGAETAALNESIAEQLAQLREQNERYLRLAAEYENFRKRAVRDRQEAELRGMGLLIRGIIDALDDIGRFAHVDPAVTDSSTIVQGVDMVERKLLKSLAGHGLEVINPVGQPFDPGKHEAVTATPAESPEEDHVVGKVFQVGYVFNRQLLRPARVAVKQWTG